MGEDTWQADPSFDRYARMVRRALGVPVALVSIVEENRQVFPGAEGLPEPYQVTRETPLSHSFCQYVVKDKQPLVIEDARLDTRLADNLAIEDLDVIAYAGWPLTDNRGNPIGSLCAIDSTPRAWTADDLAALQDLAESCSAELAQRELSRSASADTAQAQGMAARGDVLLALSEALAATRTLTDVADAVAGVATSLMGCTRAGMWLHSRVVAFETLLDDAVPEAASTSRDTLRFVAGASHHWPRADEHALLEASSTNPIGAAFTEGLPLLLSDHRQQLARFPGISTSAAAGEARAFLPLGVSDQVVGTLALVWGRHRMFSDDDVVTMSALAGYAAQAVQRALLLEERVQTSVTLQKAMLTRMPEVAGLTLTARYLPAAAREQVGGDWYDALTFDDGSVSLTIGDVVGHDIAAAAAMGQLRSALRTLSWVSGRSPAATLSDLDAALAHLGLEGLATIVHGCVTPEADHWSFCWASAGHPPPLLVSPTGVPGYVQGEFRDMMLGVDPAVERHETTVSVPVGATLLLFTDGLVERRRQVFDQGLAALADLSATHHDLPLDEMVDRVLDTLLDAVLEDDVAILAVRFDRPPVEHPAG